MTTSQRLNVYIREADLTRGMLVDAYRSLKFTKRFNAIGKWSMEIDGKSAAAVKIMNNPRLGVLIRRHGVTLFAGEIERYSRKLDADGNDVVTVSGSDDNVWLERRIVKPTPGNEYQVIGPTYAEDIMRAFVDQTLTSAAGTDRSIGLLNPASANLGWPSSIGVARWTNLLELTQGLAGLFTGLPLRFEITYDETGPSRTFNVSYIRNRTNQVIFGTTYGNIAGFEYTTEAPEATGWVVGGAGEGTARTTAAGANASDWAEWGFIERFYDRRDADTTDKLSQANREIVADVAEKRSIEIQPLEYEGDNVPTYGVDYLVGDQVALEIDGVRLYEYVTGIEFDASGQILSAKPILGSLSNLEAKIPNFFKELRKMKTQTKALQARY